MTDDIVTRLRSYVYDTVYNPWIYGEAADKIEWMLEEIQQLKHDSTIFINERSDAICENFDLREENAELREEIERFKNQLSHIIEHNNPQIEQANSYFKLLEEELARCNKIIDDYEEEHSRLREVLEEVSKAVGDPSAYMIARIALGKEETKQSTPGYEHMTPETVQAIRDTCSTPASRVGKTQSEVFKEEGTP